MSFTSDLFGSKPDVPNLPKLDLGTEQGLAITNNQNALPEAEQLASQVNLFNQQELDKMLENSMPGYGAAKGKISGQILDLAQGKIPTDISDLVQRNAAARSLYGGFGGSGAGRNLVARDLGLTSLNLQTQGLDAMSRWLKQTAAPQFDLTSMFVTPSQQAQFDVNERNLQFQKNWLQNQIDAMPDPGTTGWWNFSWSIVDGLVSAYTNPAQIGSGGGSNGAIANMGKVPTQGQRYPSY